MDPVLQKYLSFHLTNRRAEGIGDMDATFRPAHFARLSDLSELRYDLPLVIVRGASPDRTLLSLSAIVDDAVRAMGEGVERDRAARHAHRLEAHLRRQLASSGPGDFATMWHTAADVIAGDDDSVRESAMRLWRIFGIADGDLVDADSDLPFRAAKAAWRAVQNAKARNFRDRARRLLHGLRGIIEAEVVGSAAGRTPERLRAGVGTSFAGAFDFDALSRILDDSKPEARISDSRRKRIGWLIGTLDAQRFFPLDEGTDGHSFLFDSCADAIAAYNSRRDEAVEVIKALAVAELEAGGSYRESVHDPIFAGFGANGLLISELAQLPDYLVCVDGDRADAAETSRIVELLAAGLPFNVVVRTDDVLEPSAVAEGHVALGLRARQLANTAIALTDVFVLQTTSSLLAGQNESLLRGLSYDGPSLISVFSGANGHSSRLAPYLVAAAAVESRVFPAFVFDPSAGSDWASRLTIDGNPAIDDDWPAHDLLFEDRDSQARRVRIPFTAADFLALDDRFSGQFGTVSFDPDAEELMPVDVALKTPSMGDTVPAITVIDGESVLRHAIVGSRLIPEVRRCRDMWHSLQELAGIHNSHAERLLAEERKRIAEPVEARPEPVGGAPAPVLAEAVPEPEPASSDDPYIETSRCTSCNECTHVNPKMFAYNENKQAYIADPDAGTFRQLVEAAEGCQVGIIHPGKPRNPKEPGLDDLIVRAEAFR